MNRGLLALSALTLLLLPALAVSAAEPAAPGEAAVAAAPPPEPDGGTPFGFDGWKSDEPLTIKSAELEALQKDGRRQLIFEQNVRVNQGDMSMRAARLEATYPQNGGAPDRLVATGDVRFVQGEQSARCDRAVYERLAERLVCEGNARFQEGENRLSGTTIVINLATETVTVKGGASVVIQPDKLREAQKDEKPQPGELREAQREPESP